jgi:hypothetical protein
VRVKVKVKVDMVSPLATIVFSRSFKAHFYYSFTSTTKVLKLDLRADFQKLFFPL